MKKAAPGISGDGQFKAIQLKEELSDYFLTVSFVSKPLSRLSL